MFLELAYRYLEVELFRLSLQHESESYISGFSRGFVNTILLLYNFELPYFNPDLITKSSNNLIDYLTGHNFGSDIAIKLYENYTKEFFGNGS